MKKSARLSNATGGLSVSFAGADGAFDLITANPPYVTRAELGTLDDDVARFEPELALVSGESGFELIERIADHFVAAYGAPDREAALPLARQEAEFAAGLCEHQVNTLLAVQRSFNDDGIVERFNQKSGVFTLARMSNNDCLYLDRKSRLCTIYDKRPDTCRNHPKVGPRPGYCAYKPKPLK